MRQKYVVELTELKVHALLYHTLSVHPEVSKITNGFTQGCPNL